MARFYDKQAWRTLRLRILARDGYRCTVCHAYVGGVGAARVDHIRTVKAAPSRALDPANLRTLCTTCDAHGHSERGPGRKGTREERFRYGFDEHGNPRDPKHQWNEQSVNDC